MQATKTEMKYDMGSVKVKNKETGAWEVVATFPHQSRALVYGRGLFPLVCYRMALSLFLLQFFQKLNKFNRQ